MLFKNTRKISSKNSLFTLKIGLYNWTRKLALEKSLVTPLKEE